MTKVPLGSGVLTWSRSERVSDRYGAIYLMPEGINSISQESPTSLVNESAKRWVGNFGRLTAKVTAARDSTHIGDLFHGIAPRTPKVGQSITLGSGTLFFEEAPNGGLQVGVKPTDDRDTLWLKLRALYDAHEQSVELFFTPQVSS